MELALLLRCERPRMTAESEMSTWYGIQPSLRSTDVRLQACGLWRAQTPHKLVFVGVSSQKTLKAPKASQKAPKRLSKGLRVEDANRILVLDPFITPKGDLWASKISAVLSVML